MLPKVKITNNSRIDHKKKKMSSYEKLKITFKPFFLRMDRDREQIM